MSNQFYSKANLNNIKPAGAGQLTSLLSGSSISQKAPNFNNSIFTSAPKSNANATTDTLSVIATIASFLPMALLAVPLLKGSGNDGKNAPGGIPLPGAVSSAEALSSAIKAANETGKWEPVQSQLKISEADFAAKAQEMSNIQEDIDKINKKDIPEEESKLTNLADSDKKIDADEKTSLEKIDVDEKTALASIDTEETSALDSIEKQISAAKAANPQVDTTALENMKETIKTDAETKRTQTKKDADDKRLTAKNDAKDAKNRNEVTRKEINARILTHKQSIEQKNQQIATLKSAKQELEKQIKAAKDELSHRTLATETPESVKPDAAKVDIKPEPVNLSLNLGTNPKLKGFGSTIAPTPEYQKSETMSKFFKFS